MKRLARVIRSHLKAPPDCESLASFLRALAYQEGAFDIDRFESGGRLLQSRVGRVTRALARKFDAACVVKPKSAAAARKMRAVWR